MKILDIKNLSRNYGKNLLNQSEKYVNVLDKISFHVEKGEFLGIMGKSGCGKTTLLKTLGMIDKPSDGKIYFMGEDTSKLYGDKLADLRNKKIGFIFQDFYLMDSLSVEENIILPMIIGNIEMHNMHELARKYAEQFQISHLADEPTGNLDSKSGKIVIDALNRISTEYHKTIVMVTHDPQMASYCDRIILLKDGKILDEIEKNKSNGDFYSRILSKMVEL